ncbi:MAG: type II secretion system protein [Sedimentisphaerales bacterium]|nr:type II secretion system protein [Sedimentisphaerales bacterium]
MRKPKAFTLIELLVVISIIALLIALGLKDLWTLKWDDQSDTTGPGTKAGGVQPEDWPKWMRQFKDY